MVIELNNYIAHFLNAFPAKGGVSMKLSPEAIVTGITIDYKKHCKLEFGAYVQTHEEKAPRNSMTARSLGAIALGPSLGQSSGYYFMNLNTGKRIHRRSWTELPMPNEVIKRVEFLGRKDNQPELLVFTDKHGEELPNDLLEEEDVE